MKKPGDSLRNPGALSRSELELELDTDTAHKALPEQVLLSEPGIESAIRLSLGVARSGDQGLVVVVLREVERGVIHFRRVGAVPVEEGILERRRLLVEDVLSVELKPKRLGLTHLHGVRDDQ